MVFRITYIMKLPTYQLFQLSCEPVVSDSVLLDNHSHTVTTIDSMGMSKILISEGLSLGFHPGTILVSAHGHHAEKKKIPQLSLHNKITKWAHFIKIINSYVKNSFTF